MKKFTVGIITYNQMDIIEDCIKSVFSQNYSSIEVIISDDCSPGFDEKKVEKIIKKYNKQNFNYRVISMKKNRGIVNNVNNVMKYATGDYITFIAGDDVFNNNNVISEYIRVFSLNNYNIVSFQTLLCNNSLDSINGLYVDKEEALSLNNESAYDQFARLCCGCFYGAGSTAYNTYILRKYNCFDDKYKYVEDWPTWLILTMHGEKIYYHDYFALNRRDGGISHNKFKKMPMHVKLYYKDMLRVYTNIIFPSLIKLKILDIIKVLKSILKKFLKKNYHINNAVNHTYVICSYKEQPRIEDCIISLINQKVKSKIIISTSTPNDFLENIAKKYMIELRINNKKSNHLKDFWFAYDQANTKYVTLCHQDDIYDSDYGYNILKKIDDDTLIAYTNYYEIRNNKKKKYNIVLLIKALMNLPILLFNKSRRVRLFCLSLGNCICCPSVTYNKDKIKKPLIETNYVSNLDWISYISFAKINGKFTYINKKLIGHRIHGDSTTSKVINNNIKSKEDYEIFRLFWSEKIASLLLKIYGKSEISNNIKERR